MLPWFLTSGLRLMQWTLSETSGSHGTMTKAKKKKRGWGSEDSPHQHVNAWPVRNTCRSPSQLIDCK